MKTELHSYLTLLYIICCFTIQAQHTPQPHFRNFSTEHGLPSSEVHFIFEDSKGYMWFGTDNGAARFDGYEFKTYGPNDGLMSNVVFDIHEDEKGRIWFGTMTAEAFLLENDTIIPYKYNHIVKQVLRKKQRGALEHISKDETTYFNLLELGVLKIDSLGNYETIVSEELQSLLVYNVEGMARSISVNVQNREDVDQYYQYYYKQEKNMIHHVNILTNKLEFEKQLKRYKIDGFNSLGMVSDRGDVLIQVGSYLHYIVDSTTIWSIPFEFRINDLVIEESGAIWFCLDDNKGVRRYANIKALKNNQFDVFLKDLSISRMLIDSYKKYWFATLEQGAFYLIDSELVTYNTNHGLPTNTVKTITFKNDSILIVGCVNNELVELNDKKKQINHFGKIQSQNASFKSKIKTITYDKLKDRVWGGLFYFINNENNKYIKYFHPNHKTDTITTSALDNLHINSKRHLIGSLHHMGFYILDLNTENLVYQTHETKIQKRVYGLFSDHADRLWVGNQNGIFQFKDSTLLHPNITHPAFNNRVEDIDELPDSTLVFGTKGFGVVAWKGDSIIQITSDEGLSSNMLEDIHVDEKGILWAGTLNGLNKITFGDDGKPIVRCFTTHNGLPSNEINQIESYEGQVWLCTAGGLVKFHETTENIYSPTPLLQWTKVNGTISNKTKASFAYDQNNIEFKYLALNYRMNGKIPYRYRISENKDWQYTQNLSVNYSSLVSNDYSFEVQSQNEDRYWSSSMIYNFTVYPPWWRTWWFRTLSILTISIIGYRLYKYRTYQLVKEATVQKQVIELERSALQAQMNPHFIFNCLNSIQNYILKNDTKNAVEYLSRFAQLVRHNLNASVQGEVSLEEEINILNNYLALERERFEQKFDFEINVDKLIDSQFIEFPPLLIQPYVENAVMHGLSNKEEKGMIEINFYNHNGNLLVYIKDNGVGYRKDKSGKKLNRHKSVGMTITQKRLELLGANSNDIVKIKTITEETGKPKGTEVSILIKI